jgi:hypothetical protein
MPAYARKPAPEQARGARDEPVAAAHSRLAAYAGRKVVAGLRPGCLPAAADGHTGPALAGDVDLVEALGAELMVPFTIDARRTDLDAPTISALRHVRPRITRRLNHPPGSG